MIPLVGSSKEHHNDHKLYLFGKYVALCDGDGESSVEQHSEG